MNSHFLPTLLHMAAVKTALALNNDKDLEILLNDEFQFPLSANFFYRERHELWKKIEMIAADKLTSIPTALQISVPKYMKPIQEETRQWFLDHAGLLGLTSNDYRMFKNFPCWKSDGTIDAKQTAKTLIERKDFGIPTRFAVACTYFLEDELRDLWSRNKETIENAMIEASKRIFNRGYPCLRNGAIRFWMKRLRGGSWRNGSWIEIIDEYLEDLNPRHIDVKLRISCFFPYLSWENKKLFFPSLLYNNHGDDLRLCMLAMNERERLELYQQYPASSLISCLEWPLQSFFMELANKLCIFMDTSAFIFVLSNITILYILPGYEDFDYVKLLKDFWDVIPTAIKEKIKTDKEFYAVIEVVFDYDKGNAKLSLPEIMEESVQILNNRPCTRFRI